MEVALIITVFFSIAGLVIFIAWFYDKKRSEDLKAIANSLNFSFERKGDEFLISMNDDFELFSHGRSKKIYNVMNGRSGDMDITIMDYQYTVGGGKNSSTHAQTIIMVQSNQLELPPFTLTPETVFHKIGSVFGYQDIDFASHPKFSKQYLLRGDDEEYIKETFKEELLDFYEKDKTLNTEAEYDKFVYYKANKKLAPKEIHGFLQESIDLYGLLKT